MKELELTKEQEHKLLTMVEIKCREYVERSRAGAFLHYKDTEGKVGMVPWFEFCLRDLIYRFLTDSPLEIANELERFAQSIIMVGVHPVDYLWALFKEYNI